MARLDQICRLNMGQSPDSSSYNENGKGMPFFQGNADFGKIHPRVRVWCSAPTKVAHTGDVLISVRAPIGALNIADRECCIGRGLAALTVNEKLCNKDYLWYAIASKVDELNSKGTGSTFKAISKSVLAETEIPLPALTEQQNVAGQLAKVDALISLRKQQLTKLDELVKARFVELFGDTKSNERKWNTLPLRKVLESGSSVSYGIVQTGDDIEGGVPVFRPIDIAGGKIPRREQLKRTANDISNQYSRTLLKGYELLITVRGSVGETFRVTSEFAGCNVGRNIVPLRFDTEIVDYSFMQHFFAQEGTKRVLESMTKGIALQGLNMSEFREIDVIIPAMSLQQQFAAFVEQTDKSKLDIQQSLDKLETLKKSLMQKYFG